ELFEDALAVFRETKAITNIGVVLGDLGRLALAAQDYAEAARRFQESLRLLWKVGWRTLIPRNLAGIAEAAAAQGEPERAARLFGAAAGLQQTLGFSHIPEELDGRMIALHERLDPETLAAAWVAGRALSWEQAIAEALGTHI